MYVANLQFKVIADTDFTSAEHAIRHYIETLIFNGQALGREFPTAWQNDAFSSRIVVPEEDALHTKNHSKKGLIALEKLGDAGLSYPKLTILGMDLMSQHTAPSEKSDFYIFYSRFSDTCSPIRTSEELTPVPLYKFKTKDSDHEKTIRWQLQYQALDEIQMQESRVLKHTAERSLQQVNSELNKQGRTLAKALESATKTPVYYALYSGSSKNCQQEQQKLCPCCGGNWKLSEAIGQLFDFKCDNCRLVSNIAWECQSPS